MRFPLVEVCQRYTRAKEALREALAALQLQTLKQHLRADEGATIDWGGSFESTDYESQITNPRATGAGESWQILLSSDLLDSVELNRKDIANGLVGALQVREGEEFLTFEYPESSDSGKA